MAHLILWHLGDNRPILLSQIFPLLSDFSVNQYLFRRKLRGWPENFFYALSNSGQAIRGYSEGRANCPP
jgi:hypothetical protein